MQRFSNFARSLLWTIRETALRAELIIVEWNPPIERSNLREAVSWESFGSEAVPVRIIQVSPTIHATISNPGKFLLFEYLGKNVGIRRARGDYILATNPDVLLNLELMRHLARRKLKRNCFYRTSRFDVTMPEAGLPMPELLQYCKQNIIRINGYFESYEGECRGFSIRRKWHEMEICLRYFISHFPYFPPFTNAAGDFMLMHRNSWDSIRGYAEFETTGTRHHLDGLAVLQARYSGLRQVILRSPLRLYHQDHGRPESVKLYSEVARNLESELIQKRQVCSINTEDWGLGSLELREVSPVHN